MGVLVAVVVAQLLHQLGGGVAYVQRHWQVARLSYCLLRVAQCHVCAVALYRRCKIYRTLRQRDAAFRVADFRHRLKAGVGQQQRVGIAVADVFRGKDEHPAGDKHRVFAALYHAGQPVDGGVRVASAHRFDEGADDVVVHLALFVVKGQVLLHHVGGSLVVNHHRPIGTVVHHQLDGVEQLAGVASRYAEQGFVLLHLHRAALRGIVTYGAVDKLVHLFFAELFQHIHLAARQQCRDDLERGILGRGTYQGDDTLLHGAEQRVLLAFRKAVYLVDKQDGVLLLLGLVYHLAHLLHAAADGAQRVEGAVQHVAYHHGQGGLADARRPPENHRRDAAALHQRA